jgi:WD40 repeat protein
VDDHGAPPGLEPEPEPRTILKTRAGEVHALAFSPDGGILATGGKSGTMELWERATAEVQTTLQGHAGWVFGLAYSPIGETLASASHDGTVKIWDVASGREQSRPGAEFSATNQDEAPSAPFTLGDPMTAR